MGDEEGHPLDPAAEAERLRRENERLKDKLEAALERERRLRRENRDLKKKLTNALHKAAAVEATTPSSRKLFKPAKKHGRHRPRGAQPGHPPHHREDPKTPDAIIEVTLDQCPDCGTHLEGSSDVQTQRLVDIVTPEPIHAEVRYHRY